MNGMNAMVFAAPRQVGLGKTQSVWTQPRFLWLMLLSLVMIVALIYPDLAMAGAGGGAGGGPTGGATGTAAATQTRILGVVTGWQLIMFAIGAFILSGAFMWVGYSLAFGGKRWSDVANVVYGAMIAGMGPMLVAWFFS